MTPEQIEWLRRRIGQLADDAHLFNHGYHEITDKHRAAWVAALAVITPEAEADRRLGAKVRALGIDPKWCDLEADRWDSVAGSIELDTTSAARVSRMFAALHRLLAAALREGGGR